MPIIEPDAIIRADNYINKSERDATPANDEGRVPKLESDGYLDPEFVRNVAPIVKVFSNIFGGSTTQFDITNPSGDTFRYTYDATGTNPNINSTTVPIGTVLVIAGTNFNAANNGTFVVTGVGSNYFEVENASGVVESNVTIGSGSIKYGYQKPEGVKYITVEVQGGGGGGENGEGTGSGDGGGNGGSGGGYAKKLIDPDDLATTEEITVGAAGSAPGGNGGDSSFTVDAGSTISATGGGGSGSTIGTPGSGSNGDINTTGQKGGAGASQAQGRIGGVGGVGMFSGGYGSGGEGGTNSSGGGQPGKIGAVIVTEHFI